MMLIYNKFFPFGNFYATNIFGLIFCRSDKGRLSEVQMNSKLEHRTAIYYCDPMASWQKAHIEKNHEYIHTLQQREMLFVGFIVWYVVEWCWRYAKCHNFMKAYRDLYFEREAYQMEHDLDYRHHRRHFAWWHMYVRKQQKNK